MKTKTIPFDLETAKKIQAGEIKGRITTENHAKVRIVCWDMKNIDDHFIVGLVTRGDGTEFVSYHNKKGECYTVLRQHNLILEIQDTEPQFKPFDKVLARLCDGANWTCDIFSYICDDKDFPYVCVGTVWGQCIPYEGNEHLVGTANKPNEE